MKQATSDDPATAPHRGARTLLYSIRTSTVLYASIERSIYSTLYTLYTLLSYTYSLARERQISSFTQFRLRELTSCLLKNMIWRVYIPTTWHPLILLYHQSIASFASTCSSKSLGRVCTSTIHTLYCTYFQQLCTFHRYLPDRREVYPAPMERTLNYRVE